jgi:hypothetical protein
MRQIVVGVFEQLDAARAAIAALARERVDPRRVHATSTPALELTLDPPAAAAGAGARPAAPASLRRLLDALGRLFGTHGDLSAYERAKRRGGTVISVDVDDPPQAALAERAFVRAGAIDVTRRPHD